ncbi:MAG: FHA domain-containing protein [Gammaproteobacteria bacterium]|nr:FHA domain-containing protein [Gammaproteobacteria bacterium]
MAELIQYANGVPGIRFSIDKPITRIGRNDDNNDICVPDSFVSKEHALIEMIRSTAASNRCEFVIHDLGSTNRTYVNKKEISHVQLKNNDIIYIGENMFRFHCSGDEIFEAEAEEVESSDTIEFESESIQFTNSFSRRLRILGME